MSGRITFWVLMALWLGATGSDCVRPLPDPLHCLSRMSFVNKALKSTDYLKLDEYLDVKASKTSISIYDAREDSTEIHYNKLNSRDLNGRQSVVFNPSDLSCKSQEIGSWQLAELRRVAINFYKFEDLSEKFVDVPIGPSLLLYTVQTYTGRFKFVKSIVSKSLMSNVNVYTLQIQGMPANSIFRNLLIVLHVSTEGQKRGLKLGDSLEDALLKGAHLDVKFFGACQLETKVRASKRAKTESNETNTGQNDLWNEDDFCSSDSKRSLLFKVHYDIIEEYKTGTLVGKELDEFVRDEHDFTHEPFLQPVGIGCWSLDVNLGRQRGLIEISKTGGVLVSASYRTSNGLKGVSYVAYDEIGQLLRLDRQGRKSIYDLARGQSYHVAQQSSSSGLRSFLANQLATEKCIVLSMVANSCPINRAGNIMLQLFGLGPTHAHYLGTRTIEHEPYEVYENSFKNFDKETPILLQTRFDGTSKSKERMTYYVTYYVQQNRLLRFIELYSFDTALRRRKLVNRLEFIQFSWSLEVEPEDDPQSDLSDSNLRLFQMESCLQNRATQSQLVMTLESSEVGSVNLEEAGKGLQYHMQELADSVQRMLADSLEVSLLNIVDLKLDLSSFAKNGKVLTTSRVVDLRTGIAKFQSLGMTYVIDDGHLLQRNEFRFSFEECLLDSLEFPKASRFAHCPQLAACLLFEEGAKVEFELMPNEPDHADGKGPCHVFTVKYATLNRYSKASYDAAINQRYLADKEFSFEVGSHEDETTGQSRPGFTYTARTNLKDFVQLDPVGAQLLGKDDDNLDILSGLRYTTMREEPQAHNLNIRVAMGKQMNDMDRLSLFTHCQLSCQLDEFCGSFSICYKSKGPNASDCVLSTLRLTSERVDKILAGASQIREGETRFLVNITSELASQVFNFHRDDACSLHPREFAPDFMLFKSVTRVHEHGRAIDELDTHKLETVRTQEQMSFEDCAGLSFERTFGCDSIKQTNFTYCPLDSLCLVEGDEIEEQLKLASGPCRSYERQATRFYSGMRSTHMRIVGVKATNSSDEALISDLVDSKIIDKSSKHLVRSFWGVTEGDCARDCSFHKSECLAFDSCRNQGKILCILYSVRSRLSRRGAHLPLLEREKELTEDGVTLITSPICDHFYLKPAYFEVRLRNLLARQTLNTGSSDESEFFPDEVKALEDKIEAYDEKQDREDLLAVTDYKKIVDNFEQASGTHSESTKTSSSALIHWWPLMIGLLLGCTLTVYKQEVTQVAINVYGLVRRETPIVTIR